MASILCDGIELFGDEHIEELMNMYLISKRLRVVYLMDTTERDWDCAFRRWAVKNAWFYGLYAIESRSKENIFFINIKDYPQRDKIRNKTYRRKSMGRMLEYYSPTGKLTHNFHYRLSIRFYFDSLSRQYILFNQLSAKPFSDSYISDLLERFNSIHEDSGYHFKADIDDDSYMFMCDCENCQNANETNLRHDLDKENSDTNSDLEESCIFQK